MFGAYDQSDIYTPTGGGGGGVTGASMQTMEESAAIEAVAITATTSSHCVMLTRTLCPLTMSIKAMAFCLTTQSDALEKTCLCIYDGNKNAVCKTGYFGLGTIGEIERSIGFIWNGSAWVPSSQASLIGGKAYYMGVFSKYTSTISAARFKGAGLVMPGPQPRIVVKCAITSTEPPGSLSELAENEGPRLLITARA